VKSAQPYRPRRPAAKSKINREPSRLIAGTVPWVSILLASGLTGVILVASAPVIPPFAFLMFVAWRQLRPGLLPVWAGLPLGIVDDLFSGQPVGSAVLLWSLAAIALDAIELRLPWRNFNIEWLVAAGMIAAYILLSLAIANMAGGSTGVLTVLPLVALSILAYPPIGRLVALLDRFRLTPFVEIS